MSLINPPDKLPDPNNGPIAMSVAGDVAIAASHCQTPCPDVGKDPRNSFDTTPPVLSVRKSVSVVGCSPSAKLRNTGQQGQALDLNLPDSRKARVSLHPLCHARRLWTAPRQGRCFEPIHSLSRSPMKSTLFFLLALACAWPTQGLPMYGSVSPHMAGWWHGAARAVGDWALAHA